MEITQVYETCILRSSRRGDANGIDRVDESFFHTEVVAVRLRTMPPRAARLLERAAFLHGALEEFDPLAAYQIAVI